MDQVPSPGLPPCRDLLLVVRGHLERIDARIEELARLRRQLASCLEQAPGVEGGGRICGMIEGLAGASQVHTKATIPV